MVRAVASSLLLLSLAGLAHADELHRQDPVNSFSGLSSQDARNPGGLGMMYETAVDFQGQAGWNVTGIEFWGGYPRIEPGNTHGFMIRFYADSDGQVGSLLLAQDVATFTETVYYTFPPPLSFPGYHYTLTLNTPFAVPAAGQYWMSVTAILDFGGGADSVQWGWVQAQSMEGSGCAQSSFNGPFQTQPQDVAYVLNGTAGGGPTCGTADFNCDGDIGTDSDIEGFFSCLAGTCPSAPCTNSADFNGDGDTGTDSDIEAFFRVLGGGTC